MSVEETPTIIADAVRCVRDLSSRVTLSKDEQAFVNDLARTMSAQAAEAWAKHRYAARKNVRPCCMALAIAVAFDLAHNLSQAGRGLE